MIMKTPNIQEKRIDSVFMIYDKDNKEYIRTIYSRPSHTKLSILGLGRDVIRCWSNKDNRKKEAYEASAKRYEVHEIKLVKVKTLDVFKELVI